MKPSFPGPTVDGTRDLIFNDLDLINEKNVTWNIRKFKKIRPSIIADKNSQKKHDPKRTKSSKNGT